MYYPLCPTLYPYSPILLHLSTMSKPSYPQAGTKTGLIVFDQARWDIQDFTLSGNIFYFFYDVL